MGEEEENKQCAQAWQCPVLLPILLGTDRGWHQGYKGPEHLKMDTGAPKVHRGMR